MYADDDWPLSVYMEGNTCTTPKAAIRLINRHNQRRCYTRANDILDGGHHSGCCVMLTEDVPLVLIEMYSLLVTEY